MDEFRFLKFETHDAYTNMAMDEAIMLSLEAGRVPPTFRLYRWKPSAVSIGTFQGMTTEVDIEYCKKKGVSTVRRLTGGGAVYHDYEGEVTYSIIIPKDHRLAPRDIAESYRVLCGGVISALAKLGLSSSFQPINDILVEKKKISGNAQTRRHSCLLQHGTVLVRLDVEAMFSVLKVHPVKISDKVVTDVKQRVTSISDALSRRVSLEEVARAMEKGFSEALGIKLVPGKLTSEEEADVEHLVKTKYSTDSWNLLR
ncbi:MAG: lipoate--protein ligase family protein [Candidatus Thorarchaeota archaeon]|nr:lipoate--protein ligase family protein [Candidatus Thorarchaeota archaeon]